MTRGRRRPSASTRTCAGATCRRSRRRSRTAPGRPSVGHRAFAWRRRAPAATGRGPGGTGRTGRAGGSPRGPSRTAGRRPRPAASALAVHHHLDDVVRPAGLHVLDRGVEVPGDLLGCGRAEQAQVAADDVQPLGHLAEPARSPGTGCRTGGEVPGCSSRPARSAASRNGISYRWIALHGTQQPQVRLVHTRGDRVETSPLTIGAVTIARMASATASRAASGGCRPPSAAWRRRRCACRRRRRRTARSPRPPPAGRPGGRRAGRRGWSRR